MLITYVILHYISTEDTIECVDSILNNIKHNKKNFSCEIVVVDNGSPNSSYELLLKCFAKFKNVHILKSDKNIGFAKGNNIGFEFAKYKLFSDFIVCLNNDTMLIQEDFNNIIIDKYDNHQYFILGPDIITKDQVHQNPLHKYSWTFKELHLFRVKRYIKLILSYLNFDQKYEIWGNGQNDYYKEKLPQDIFDTGLHGACLIFSPAYIKLFDGFYDRTFLYMEEDILRLHADYHNFLMMYSSDLSIYHKEDASTNAIKITEQEKNRKKAKYLLHSSKLYGRLKIKMTLKSKVIYFIEKIASKVKKAPYKFDSNIPISYVLSVAFERLFMIIRGVRRSIGFGKRGTRFFCGKKVKLKCKSKIWCGDSVTLNNGVFLDALSLQGITLKNNSSIGSNTIIRCSGNFKNIGKGFTLGENSSLSDNCFIGATGGVYIGNDVIGGQNIRFHSSNHIFEDLTAPIRIQGVVAEGISVGDNCWIGSGVVFCDGVKVGNGCVIGTNTVITKNFPDNTIIAGVPARKIGSRATDERAGGDRTNDLS